MTPIKQTVYLPVNAEWEEGKPTLMNSDGEWICNLQLQEGYFFTPEQLNEYITNIIQQTLETAANVGYKEFEKQDKTYSDSVYFDKQSITNTFEETYQKLKV